MSITPVTLAAEAIRLAVEGISGGYYDNLYPAWKQVLSGAVTKERVDTLLVYARGNPELLQAARRALDEQPESEGHRLAAAMLDLAIVRCKR